MKFEDGKTKSYKVELDANSLSIVDDDAVPGPEWTELGFNRCENCPLALDKKKYCPVAKNLASVSEAFKEARSYNKVTAFVKSENRMYGKDTDLQTALQSLFGLIMASSACPHLDCFKTMAHFHLPFSSTEETITRAIGSHLTQEYILQMDNPDHKITLDGLNKDYTEVSTVNRGIIKRIRAISQGDANKNAIAILDSFAALLPMEISTGLTEVREIYARAHKRAG